MATKKIKISELPVTEDLDGLSTIGVDKDNNNVRVSLKKLKESVDTVAHIETLSEDEYEKLKQEGKTDDSIYYCVYEEE